MREHGHPHAHPQPRTRTSTHARALARMRMLMSMRRVLLRPLGVDPRPSLFSTMLLEGASTHAGAQGDLACDDGVLGGLR